MHDVDAPPKIDEAEVGRIFREESGRSVAALIRVFGDVDVTEDADQGGHRSAGLFAEDPADLGCIELWFGGDVAHVVRPSTDGTDGPRSAS